MLAYLDIFTSSAFSATALGSLTAKLIFEGAKYWNKFHPRLGAFLSTVEQWSCYQVSYHLISSHQRVQSGMDLNRY